MTRNARRGLRIASGFVLCLPAFSQDVIATYPHSILPGGIRTPQAYAEQQGNADVGFLRPEYLQHDVTAYVNFRVGNSVRWTNAKVTIQKGELVWSDKYGHMVRGRCGNDVRAERPAKGFTLPEKIDLDTPEIGWTPPPVLVAELAQVETFAFPERWPEQPAYPEEAVRPLLHAVPITPLPLVLPAFAGVVLPRPGTSAVVAGGGAVTPVFPTTAIPEPSTMWMLGSGVALLCAAKLLATKRLPN